MMLDKFIGLINKVTFGMQTDKVFHLISGLLIMLVVIILFIMSLTTVLISFIIVTLFAFGREYYNRKVEGKKINNKDIYSTIFLPSIITALAVVVEILKVLYNA